MKLLETLNNVALAFVALPESIREARAILAEQREEADDLSRIAELESELRKWTMWAHEAPRMERSSDIFSATKSYVSNLENDLFECKRELATLRAKPEPSIPEPDSKGFFTFNPDSGELKHIAKPEPQWVACTAEEAEFLLEITEWLDPDDGKWYSCARIIVSPDKRVAYRTTAALSEWVEVSSDVFAAICARDDSHLIEKSASRDTGRKIRRATVPCGTVLG